MSPLYLFGIATTIFFLVAIFVAPIVLQPSASDKRILQVAQTNRPDHRTIGTAEKIEDALFSISRRIRAQFGLAEDEKLKQRLLSAGIKRGGGTDAYFAARIIGPIIGLASAFFIHQNTVFFALVIAVVLHLAPDTWLGMKIKKRRKKISKSLPDAIDLLVICVDAGLGLDQAMLRVGQELTISHPEIHEEFMQINFEQLAGKPRLEAWKSAAERTQVQEFGLLVTMLSQADRFGTPIVRALSRFADEIRVKRRQRAEEMAAKTKVKILFPLVLFIFPCIFIVLLGPAILNIGKVLGTLSK